MANFLTNLFHDTFFKKLHDLFEKLFGSEAAIAKVISVTLGVVTPLVETIVTLTDGEPAAAAIAAVVQTVQADLATVTATVAAAGPTPTLESDLNAIITNLKALETGAGIKDSATQKSVSTAVTTIVAELQAIISVL